MAPGSPSTITRSPPLPVHVRRALFCASLNWPHSFPPTMTALTDVKPSQLVGSRAGSSRKSSGGGATGRPLTDAVGGGPGTNTKGEAEYPLGRGQLAATLPNALDGSATSRTAASLADTRLWNDV